jgi:hypothetical protein
MVVKEGTKNALVPYFTQRKNSKAARRIERIKGQEQEMTEKWIHMRPLTEKWLLSLYKKALPQFYTKNQD